METINGKINNSPPSTSPQDRGLNGEVEEPMSLIDLINSVKEMFAELKKKWLIVSIIICISSVIGLLISLRLKPAYSASTTMMLETESSGGTMSGALALASQFGLMGNSSSAVINGDKLLELIKAETIIKTALFKKATIDSTTDILANHFIDLFGYKKKWENSSNPLKAFRFKHSKENLSLEENYVFKMFYNKIAQNYLVAEKATKSGIITITTTTKSELFSKYFNQYLVEAVTDFYVNRITQKGRTNVAIVQKRVDSIAIVLNDAEFALARWKDANFQLVKAQGMIAEMKLKRNVEVCNSIYIEGIKQLEMSKFSLLQQTPFLQIIDEPTLPLDSTGEVSISKGISLGFIIGCFLSFIYVLARKKYSDMMKEHLKHQNFLV